VGIPILFAKKALLLKQAVLCAAPVAPVPSLSS